MPLSDIVNVVVSTQNPGVTQAGFGVPLITSASASWAERVRTYANIAGVGADFATTTPEYLAANAIFSQNPRLTQIKIGRLANKPTQVSVVKVTSVINTTAYVVHFFSAGVEQTATYTSDNTATNDEIAAGLASAINALAAPAPNATAVATGPGGSQVCTVTGNAAGNWFCVDINDPNLLAVHETGTDAGVAADLDAINNEDNGWYGLISLFKSDATVAAAAGWVENNTKLYTPALCGTEIATVVDGSATDEAHALKAAARARTGAFFHPRGWEFADAAEMGKFFVVSPGGDNWRLKTLSGVTPGWSNGQQYTQTQITNIKAKRANFYYILGGVNVIGGNGTVAANEYIDVVRGIDWWTARVSERLANLLIQSNKVPFTDAGIALVVTEVAAQNTEGIDAGLIAASPRPTVTAPLAANISSADKQLRQLLNVNTVWTLAGAINFLQVNATVTA